MARHWGVALVAVLAVPQVALAQTAAADGRIVYEAAFFQTFAPANALQMVSRTPGFSLESTNEEVRGFAQSAGNVVINGQRPSSKTDSLETILQRIPATRVLRIEVARGDIFGADYAGKAQVLNLVLTQAGGVAGTLQGRVFREYTGALLADGSASVLVRRGASTFNAAIGYDNSSTTEEGFDRLVSLPSGGELEYRRKINTIRDPDGYVSASWDYNGGTNRTAHVNLRRARGRFRLDQTNDVFPSVGPVRDDRLGQRYDQDNFEIGGDVTQPLAGGGIKLVALATRRHRDYRDTSFNRIAGDVVGGFLQNLADDRDETVVRAVWSRADLSGWNVETGAEGALNRLASDVDLFSVDGLGTQTRVDLPVDQAVVKEYRGEAFVSAGRPLSPKLRLDMTLTAETSRLTVTGDAQAERSLNFLKPRVTIDWRPGNDWRTQLSLQRTVAQLQFEDFISVAELANERVNGGNAELLPQRAWEVLATIQRPFLGTGLLKLEAGYQRVSLVQDRIPTPEGFDAPGNLGDGSVVILRGNLDTPLTRLGIKGGRLTVYASYASTSVRDPYTGRDRRFSGNSDFYMEASFRQDLGSFAWGITASGDTPSDFYRRNEIDRSRRDIPYLTAFAEYRPSKRTTLTLEIENLTNGSGYRERTFYSPDRTTPVPSQFELRSRDRHVVPSLTLKHSFG